MTRNQDLETRAARYLTDTASAVEHVHAYIQHTARPDGGIRHTYTGALFDTWAGGGDAEAVKDRITADDVVTLSFLSLRLPGRLQHELLREETQTLLSPHLQAMPTDVDLWQAADEHLAAADAVFSLVRDLPGAGWVTANKLLARKRPRLIPVYDRVVREALGRPKALWRPMRAWLAAEPDAVQQLRDIGAQAGAPHLSPLRVLDVVIWMAEHGAAPEAEEGEQDLS